MKKAVDADEKKGIVQKNEIGSINTRENPERLGLRPKIHRMIFFAYLMPLEIR